MTDLDKPLGETCVLEGAGLTSTATLALWLGCLAVGVLGMALPYPRPAGAPPAPPVVEAVPAQMPVEEITLSAPDAAPSPAHPARARVSPAPPPLAAAPLIPPAPPLREVAVAAPAVVFALPVRPPARTLAAAPAMVAGPPAPAKGPPPAAEGPPAAQETAPAPGAVQPRAQPLEFGQGEGRQPAPEYPRRAVRSGQEGVVRVGLAVDEHGRVTQAGAVSASPWPLLNEAALRVVRERWRFAPGPARRYEVSIRFELQK